MHVQQQGQKTVQHTTLGLKMVAAPPLRTGPLFQRPTLPEPPPETRRGRAGSLGAHEAELIPDPTLVSIYYPVTCKNNSQN